MLYLTDKKKKVKRLENGNKSVKNKRKEIKPTCSHPKQQFV